MSATVHILPTADHVIRRADLPVMAHQTTPAVEAKNLPYKLYFDNPLPDKPEAFHTLRIDWDDGRCIYLDRIGTNTLVYLIEHDHVNPDELIHAVSDSPEEYNGVYRVID